MATQPVMYQGPGHLRKCCPPQPGAGSGETRPRVQLRVQDCNLNTCWVRAAPGQPEGTSTAVHAGPVTSRLPDWRRGPRLLLKPLPSERPRYNPAVGLCPVALWWPCGGRVPGGAGGRGGCDHFAGVGSSEGGSGGSAVFSRGPDFPGGKPNTRGKPAGPPPPPPRPASGVWDVGLCLLPSLCLCVFTHVSGHL